MKMREEPESHSSIMNRIGRGGTRFVRLPRLAFMCFVLVAAVYGAICRPLPGAENPDTTNSGADQFAGWLEKAIKQTRNDLDHVAAVAEEAADVYIDDLRSIRIDGDPALCDELTTRRGGLMRLETYEDYRRGRAGGDTVDGDKAVVIYILRPESFAEDVELLRKHERHGNYVIVVGRESMMRRLREREVPFNASLNNHAHENNSLFRDDDGEGAIATHRAAGAVVMWAFMGEFVAACSRRDRMPLIYQGRGEDGAMEREKRLQDLESEFHPEFDVEPVEPTEAGTQYLGRLEDQVQDMIREDMSSIRAVAVEAARKISGDVPGETYMYVFSHMLWSLWMRAPVPYDTGYFRQLYRPWSVNEYLVRQFSEEDLILCMGWIKGDWPETAREKGVTVAWVGEGQSRAEKMSARDYLIDTQLKSVDTVIEIPDYDVGVGPTDGIMEEAVYWMVSAEIYSLLETDYEVSESPDEIRGRGALHTAVLKDAPGELRTLLEEGKEPESADDMGMTPLHLAVLEGHEKAVEVLTEAGAEVGAEDRYGRTPMDLATSRGNKKIVGILEEVSDEKDLSAAARGESG
ncbi:MAG: ankyrin repeat domain-containing protein [Planctomycetota bacterium]